MNDFKRRQLQLEIEQYELDGRHIEVKKQMLSEESGVLNDASLKLRKKRSTTSDVIASPGESSPAVMTLTSYSELSTASSGSSVNVAFFEKFSSSSSSSDIPTTTSSNPVPLEFFEKSILEDLDSEPEIEEMM